MERKYIFQYKINFGFKKQKLTKKPNANSIINHPLHSMLYIYKKHI